jgi:hypothetical protein
MLEVLDASARTRLPVSRMTPTVDEVMVFRLVDQTADLESSIRTILPSVDMVRRDDFGLETGESLFATHTGTCSDILLYHMPMYQRPELSVAHQKKM